MKPEEKAEIILYCWLRPKVSEIYFNRKNKLSAPIFKVKGKKDKKIIDLIIKTIDGKYIAVEVKPSINNHKIIEGASQMYQRYYLEYCFGNKNFYIDDELINIHSFVIASDLSINCHLFKNRDYLVDNLDDKDNKHKNYCVNTLKTIPRYEFSTTYQFVRTMWKTLNEDLKRIKDKFKRYSGIGILIADYDNREPYIFIKYKTKKFSQHYWRLGK